MGGRDSTAVGSSAVDVNASPVGVLFGVDVGVDVVGAAGVSVVVSVGVGVGTGRCSVSDGGRTSVATMVECVLSAASDTPTHML